MTMHACPDCRTRTAHVVFGEGDVKAALRRLERRPESERLQADLAARQKMLAESKENLERHESECRFQPEAPRPVRGVRGKSQPKSKPAKVKPQIDRAVLVAAIAAQPPLPPAPRYVPAGEREPSRLDVGGDCETCGKWIPGERRFCGLCLAKRSR